MQGNYDLARIAHVPDALDLVERLIQREPEHRCVPVLTACAHTASLIGMPCVCVCWGRGHRMPLADTMRHAFFAGLDRPSSSSQPH
jgi:hypothetical protein